MIQQTLTIDFDEYLSYLDDGEIKVGYEEHAQCCLNAFENAINSLLADADTVAHHSLNLNGGPFKAKIQMTGDEGIAELNIQYSGNATASFLFEISANLVLSKTSGLVSIFTE